MGQSAYSIAMQQMGDLINKANLNEKAVEVALEPINAQLAETEQQIIGLESVKADKTEVSDLAESKADKTDLEATNVEVTTKAPRSYVDEQIASVASGAPKGTFATLAALQSAHPLGDSGNYVVASDGHIYSWSGTTWTDTGIQYQSTGIARGAVTQERLAFTALPAIQSKNLFDKDAVTAGYYIDYLTGALTVNPIYSASDFVLVNPSTQYTQKSDKQFAFYDSNKTYISGLVSSTTFTTPSNCYYVRTSVLTNTLWSEQIEQGGVSTSYESYIPKVNLQSVPDKAINQDKLSFPVVDGQVSKNLFNKAAVTDNVYPNYLNGNLEPNVLTTASEFIPIQPSTVYTRTGNDQMAFYNANKAYVSGLASGTTFTTPAGAAFVRITVRKTILDTEQLELGGTATAYASYGVKIKNDSLPDQLNSYVQNSIVTFVIELPSDIYLVSGESFSVYYNNVIKYSQVFRKGEYYIAHINRSGPSAKGVGYDYKWEYTPTEAETFIIEFAIFETNTRRKVAFKQVTFRVADSANPANHGRVANIVTIGDSFTDLYGVSGYLYSFLKNNGGGNLPNMIGTRNSSVPEAKDDAISGWGYTEFTTWASQGETKINAFWNPTTSQFDFSYYISQNFPAYVPSSETGPHIDAFISILGLNDSIWNGFNKTTMQATVQKVIDSVHAFDPNIKVLLSTVTPQPIGDKFLSDFGNYGTGGSYEKSKYNQELWNEMMMSFHNPSKKVYVIPTNAHFDTRNAIISATYYPDKFTPAYSEVQTTDIHPTPAGAKYIADAMYQALYTLALR